jgi:hypothetical protein
LKPSSLLFFILIASTVPCRAQTVHQPVTAAYIRSGAYSTSQPDAFSFGANQAALAQTNHLSAGLFAERRFLMQELSSFHLAFALPTASGGFGVNTGYFGNMDHNELQAGLAYGRKLGKKVSAGVQFNYYTIGVNGYGRASSVNFEGGLMFQLTGQCRAGIHAYNPTGSKIGKYGEEKLSSIYSMGLGYDASDRFFLSGSIEKTEDRPVNVQAALHYQFDQKLLARAGFSSGTANYFLGAGVLFSDLRLDVTASVHPQLGITPGLLLVYKTSGK